MTMQNQFLAEARLMDVLGMLNRSKEGCQEQCERIVKKDQHNQDRLSLCVSACKIKATQKVLRILQTAKEPCYATKNPEKCIESIESKIRYFNTLLFAEKNRIMAAKKRLMTNLKKLPADMSLRPSPERTNVNHLKGKE